MTHTHFKLIKAISLCVMMKHLSGFTAVDFTDVSKRYKKIEVEYISNTGAGLNTLRVRINGKNIRRQLKAHHKTNKSKTPE